MAQDGIEWQTLVTERLNLQVLVSESYRTFRTLNGQLRAWIKQSNNENKENIQNIQE
jgi:hypothetical protein